MRALDPIHRERHYGMCPSNPSESPINVDVHSALHGIHVRTPHSTGDEREVLKNSLTNMVDAAAPAFEPGYCRGRFDTYTHIQRAVQVGPDELLRDELMREKRDNDMLYINTKEPSLGYTALHMAAAMGSVPKIKLLLLFGADLFILSDTEQTPFDLMVDLDSLYQRGGVW